MSSGKDIHLDFETFSELDVRDVGSWRYAKDPSTEVLIASWAYNDGKVGNWSTIDKSSEALDMLFMRVRAGWLVHAHNAHFEWCVWNYVLRPQLRKRGINVPRLRPKQIRCTAARAAMCSLPRSLERAAAALKLPHQKDKRGAQLIKLFSMPRKPTKRDPRERILPRDEPEAFREFIEYCDTDVEVERDIDKALPELPPFEQETYLLDMRVNARGLPIDLPLIKRATHIVTQLEQRAHARVSELTGGLRPTQVEKIRQWLNGYDLNLDNMQADTLAKKLEDKKLPAAIRELLLLRLEASRVSTKKLISMARCADLDDGRVRGTILYYGAHTGRFSGRLIQPHNFIRGLLKLPEQQRVFKLLEQGDADIFEALYDRPLSTIAQVMRGFIAAGKGKRLLVADFSAIEARVLAWLAREQWILDAYYNGIDVYKQMAALLWNIRYEEVDSEQRRIAKNLVLGCGYGLGWRKFIEYCAKVGLVIDEELAKRAVNTYRDKSKAIVEYWGAVERCAIACVRTGKPVRLRDVMFHMQGDYLCVRLPSGRDLYYPHPKVRPCIKFNKPSVELTFMTEDKYKRWIRVGTYGGRLVENIVQAVARDLLVVGMRNAEREGYPIVGNVHDELLSELAKGVGSIKKLLAIMCKPEAWAKGCPISGEGFEAIRYRKAA